MSDEDEVDLEPTREEQASGPGHLECLLMILEADFPELVERARAALADERIPRREAEALVREMIANEATWLRSRRSRFSGSWIRSRIRRGAEEAVEI